MSVYICIGEKEELTFGLELWEWSIAADMVDVAQGLGDWVPKPSHVSILINPYKE